LISFNSFRRASISPSFFAGFPFSFVVAGGGAVGGDDSEDSEPAEAGKVAKSS
jgi:hypothetical protein